jgi:hypothetical protein
VRGVTKELHLISDGHSLVFLKGEICHKDLWLVDLYAGIEKQLTKLPLDLDISDFNRSPDGNNIVLERVKERSEDIVLPGFSRR